MNRPDATRRSRMAEMLTGDTKAAKEDLDRALRLDRNDDATQQ